MDKKVASVDKDGKIIDPSTLVQKHIDDDSDNKGRDFVEGLRLRLKKIITASTFGKIYEKFLILLSILSTVEFIYTTYLSYNPNPQHMGPSHLATQLKYFNWLELALAGIFSLDWLLSFFIADQKVIFIKSFYSMIDLLTVIPTFALFSSTKSTICPSISELFLTPTFKGIIFYILNAASTTRILRALRIRKQLASIEDAVDRTMAEIVLSILVMILFNSALIQFLESEIQPHPFHTWAYVMWITAATVGYGDISPKSPIGRCVDMGMIAFAIIQVPRMTNDLIEKMNLQSIYARMVYTPKSRSSCHVVLCGDLRSTSINEFLEELFHADHEADETHCIILQPDPPSFDMLMLLRDLRYSLNVTYLQGSALIVKDLERCVARRAAGIFIMSNKFSSSADEEDARTILQQFSIKRYIQSGHEKDLPKFYMQLVRPENRKHLVRSSSAEESCDVVVCLNELKMGIIAKAVMFPGTSTLVMNLIASFADDTEEADELFSKGEIDVLQDDESSNWIEEYQKGCDWEIYMSELSDVFEGTKFSTLSELLYQKLGVVLFGLQVEDLRKEKSQVRILLNPGDFTIPLKSDFKIEAFVMAKNKKESDLSFSHETEAKKHLGVALKMSDLSHLSFIGNLPGHKGLMGNKKYAQPGAANTHRTHIEIDDHQQNALPWQKLLRKLGEHKTDASAHQEAFQKVQDLHLRENYYLRTHPMELTDAIIRTSVTEEVHNINEHVIIMGKSLNNLFDLIRPLRARYLGALKYIVILYPDDVPFSVWQRISIFEAILVVRGSPLEEADIRRAGIFKAQQVIVLGSSMDSNDSANDGMESLVDADAIFSYQCVRRMNERAQVVVEMVRTQNIAYLDPEFSLKSGDVDYKFTPQFAAGYLFTSSLLDTIVCQAFYNPQIVKVVNKLVSGVEYKDFDEIGASTAAHIKPKGLMAVVSSALYQISIPDTLESRTYGALYKHLAESDVIPLGILRGVFPQMKMGPKSNTTAYVFTNPPKDTELFSCDKVYVLSQKPLNFNKKASKELEKEMQLYESVRRRKNVMEDAADSVSAMRKEVSALSKSQAKLKEEVGDAQSVLQDLLGLIKAAKFKFADMQDGNGIPEKAHKNTRGKDQTNSSGFVRRDQVSNAAVRSSITTPTSGRMKSPSKAIQSPSKSITPSVKDTPPLSTRARVASSGRLGHDGPSHSHELKSSSLGSTTRSEVTGNGNDNGDNVGVHVSAGLRQRSQLMAPPTLRNRSPSIGSSDDDSDDDDN